MTKRRVALLVVLLAVLALWTLRGPIALRVMDRALARNMTADPIAELPDGLHVLLCGAGGPLP
ncbi:MAG: MBL fold metallo-hydrolase, partial [Myxococcota bacterium]